MVKLRLIICILLFAVIGYSQQETQLTIVTPGRVIPAARGIAPAETLESGRFIITFPSEPGIILLEQLEEAGISLGPWIGGHSYFINLNNTAGPSALPVESILYRPQTEDRITPVLRHRLDLDRSSPMLALTVRFFEDVPPERAYADIERIGVKLRSQKMLVGHRMIVDAGPSQVQALAGLDTVMYIYPAVIENIPMNSTAAVRSKIDLARDEFNLSGDGVKVGIIDTGRVLASHSDFDDRVINIDNEGNSIHSTHVTGTILGAGHSVERARGMAPRARGYVYRYSYIFSKMMDANGNFGVRLFNGSYSASFGLNFLGLYHEESRLVDSMAYDKGLILVFAAGNLRDNDLPDGIGPYRTIDAYVVAKNSISVGATTDNDEMTDFSCWGPTGDGRIKPDIVANGTSLFSTDPNGTYFFMSGTSSSTPVVTGGAALLIEHFLNSFGREPSVAEMRGLLIITATDLGRRGPDYEYGFGLLNVLRASRLISAASEHNLIVNDTARKKKREKNERLYFTFTLPADVSELRAALVWTDPPAIPPSDPTASVLVNDLDISLYWTKQKKRRTRVKKYEPWVLDPANPSSSASRGVNRLDNVELVEIDNPKSGVWFMEISNGIFNEGKQQKFTLFLWTDLPISGSVEKTSRPAVLSR